MDLGQHGRRDSPESFCANFRPPQVQVDSNGFTRRLSAGQGKRELQIQSWLSARSFGYFTRRVVSSIGHERTQRRTPSRTDSGAGACSAGDSARAANQKDYVLCCVLSVVLDRRVQLGQRGEARPPTDKASCVFFRFKMFCARFLVAMLGS